MRRAAGYTLIELLVGLAILGMIAAMLVAGLGTSGLMAARARTQADALEPIASAQMVLRARLERLRAAPKLTSSRSVADIDGQPQSLDFTGALGKVVEKGKTGPLREEFQMVLKQLKMGKTREEALKMMVARVDLPALTTFVTALIQGLSLLPLLAAGPDRMGIVYAVAAVEACLGAVMNPARAI